MRLKTMQSMLRRGFWAALVLLGAVSLLAVSAETERKQVLVLTVADAIGPATADYIIRGIARAERDGAELVVLKLNTPGGLDSSMRDIIEAQLGSAVPVATYVHPAGARAASAGTYMLYGSHVAAMTPATHLGAATPVQLGGGEGGFAMDLGGAVAPARENAPSEANGEAVNDALTEEAAEQNAAAENAIEENAIEENGAEENGVEENGVEENGVEEDEPRRGENAMERKVLEDAVSYIRGLAERFDRNADWAEQAVREGVTLTATDALQQNVIDFVADDLNDLLEQLHGHAVPMAWGEQVLDTEGIEVVAVDPDWRTRLLSVIASPNIAYILMLIGIYGLIFELSNPGAIVPGVIGAISLLLAFYALQVMPVNYAGLALILLGLAFMVGEAFLPSFGILGIGGVVAFVTGSIMLWDDPTLEISLPLIIGTALVVAVFTIWVLGRLFQLRRVEPTIGRREMIGAIGEARQDFDHQGRVYVRSELWTAETTAPVERGQKVRVLSIEGLRLRVEPIEDSDDEGAAESRS